MTRTSPAARSNLCGAGLLAAGLSMFALACGSTVDVDDSSGGAGGNGGDGGTGAAGGQCGGYENEASLGTVTFTIENESGRTIYLPYICGGLSSSIESLPDQSLPPSGSACMTCEEMIQSGFSECPVGGACQEEVLALEPGGSTSVSWGGMRGSEDLLLLAQCADSPAAQQCRRVLAAEEGDYEFVVRGYDTCENCECDLNPELDTCIGSAGGVEALPDPAVFSFPTDDEVRVIFGPCAFGCAAPGQD